jgi:hypothetical protein
MLSVLKDRVHLDYRPVFLRRKKEGIGGHGLQFVMSWDGTRTLDESVWKDVLGAPVCLRKLSEDLRGALSRGGPLAAGKGSPCGRPSPQVRISGQGCRDWGRLVSRPSGGVGLGYGSCVCTGVDRKVVLTSTTIRLRTMSTRLNTVKQVIYSEEFV